MDRKIINTPNAPAPIGPYNQAVFANGILFISGQVAIDPKTGDLILDDIEQETHRVMKNLKAVLDKAGMTFAHVVKTTIFLKDMNQFGKVNSIYATYFESMEPPARETVEVSNLPKFVNVEISMIAMMEVSSY